MVYSDSSVIVGREMIDDLPDTGPIEKKILAKMARMTRMACTVARMARTVTRMARTVARMARTVARRFSRPTWKRSIYIMSHLNTKESWENSRQCATFLFLSHFDLIFYLLLDRRTATWNVFI